MFVSTFLEWFPSQFKKSFSMLQSFVTPETSFADSVWIASNCLFDSDEQLSHAESLYSSNGRMNEMYNFSSDFLLTLNLRALKRLTLVQAFRDIFIPCASTWKCKT